MGLMHTAAAPSGLRLRFASRLWQRWVLQSHQRSAM
jgi:hypothetical protein